MENVNEIDWANLSFGYRKTDYNVRCYHRDGKWGVYTMDKRLLKD